jgi:hypothetical protein
VLRPMIANLQSTARTADDEAEQERLARDEQQRGAGTVVQPFRDPFAEAADGEADIADPFAYSDLRGYNELVVPISRYPDGSPAWEDSSCARYSAAVISPSAFMAPCSVWRVPVLVQSGSVCTDRTRSR